MLHFNQKMPQKHSIEVFIGFGCKDWVLERFSKISILTDFRLFLEKALEFIPWHLELVFDFIRVAWAMFSIKMAVIILFTILS